MHFLREESNNEVINVPLVVTKAEMLLLLLRYALKYYLPFVAFINLVKLINCFSLAPLLPDTGHLLDKLFNPDNNIHFHAICPTCNSYVGEFKREDRVITCQYCDELIQLKSRDYHNFFIIIDVKDEISKLIKSNYDYYCNVVNGTMYDPSKYRDIQDGKCYQEFLASLPDHTRQSYISAIFNSDGAPVFKSSSYSIWPIQLVINELPFHIRTSNPIVAGLWFGRDKPNMKKHEEHEEDEKLFKAFCNLYE